MDQQRIYKLLEQEWEGKLSATDALELDELKMQEGNEAVIQAMAILIKRTAQQPKSINAGIEDAGFKTIMSIDTIAEDDAQTILPVHRIHFLKTAWFRYAAAILLILSTVAYLWITQYQKEEPSVATNKNPVPVQNDVAPGGNKALLTLADGSKIVLDSAANGKLAEQGTSTIEKRDGQVIYKTAHRSPLTSNLAYNTMSTPRGGQYQLTLPDGSQVWLNAESSITYPTAFTGKMREVSITGEAYFEVAKNKTKPFIVNAGDQTIEVLGTHFNVNTYKEELTNKTTLLEGSVRIKTVHTSLTLKPGQQGILTVKDPLVSTDHRLTLATSPDVEQAVAWKNDIFNFNNVTLEQAMKQLQRWYDVEVVYDGGVPDITFGGKMQRSLTLGQVMRALSAMGVKFRIENKKLIVSK